MTTDQYTYRAANAIPNDEPDITILTVDQFAQERGIGKRHAYTLLHRMAAEQHAEATIPTGQRDRVLEILYRSNDSIPESRMLMQALQDEGYAIDGHDAVKTLWSLQKTGHVKFRERQNPKYLYGIRLTDLGKAEGRRLTTKPKAIKEVVIEEVSVVEEPPVPSWTVVTNVGPDQQDEAYDRVAEHIAKVAANAALLQQEIDDLGAGKPEPQPIVPWIASNMGGWPSMRDVRDRARKVTKIREAAALLEEVGEDDAVLALLDKITFTPLEEEVVALLRFLKEAE